MATIDTTQPKPVTAQAVVDAANRVNGGGMTFLTVTIGAESWQFDNKGSRCASAFVKGSDEAIDLILPKNTPTPKGMFVRVGGKFVAGKSPAGNRRLLVGWAEIRGLKVDGAWVGFKKGTQKLVENWQDNGK